MIVKWIQIAATVVLAAISAAVLLRDWKYHDKRTTAYKRLTAAMVGVMIVASLALGWSMWKTFPKPEPRPAFSFFLNGKQLENGHPLSLVVTNRARALSLVVKNHGEAIADRVTVHVIAQAGVLQPASGWLEEPSGYAEENGEIHRRTGTSHFWIECQSLLDPTCFFSCPELSLREQIQLPYSNGFAVVTTSKGGPRDAAWVELSLVAGSGHEVNTN